MQGVSGPLCPPGRIEAAHAVVGYDNESTEYTIYYGRFVG